MEKTVTMEEFTKDLVKRIDENKTIDCCKVEIKKLAEMAKKHMPEQKITVEWKDN